MIVRARRKEQEIERREGENEKGGERREKRERRVVKLRGTIILFFILL